MAAPDSRRRNTVVLNSATLPSSIPAHVLPRIIVANAALAVSVYATKESLFALDVGVFWILMRVLACGGLGAVVYESMTKRLARTKSFEWPVLAISSLFILVQQACFLTALLKLPSIRVLLITTFAPLWLRSLVRQTSRPRTLVLISAFALSYWTDAKSQYNDFRAPIPAYLAITLHAIATVGLEHAQGVLVPVLGQATAAAATTLGACIISLPVYVFSKLTVLSAPSPILPLLSLSVLPLLTVSLLLLSPNSPFIMTAPPNPSQHVVLSHTSLAVVTGIVGMAVFYQYPSWTDILTSLLLSYGVYSEQTRNLTARTRAPTMVTVKSYLNKIIANDESRKIFYFLMLNMAYMLVQMLYGVWTNSLGLISDAIHMAFDCMAIAVGLFASVMATWPPNERFTYGYGRIETLSGFANGIFLILISVFIIFEAIERLMEPPEMNTNQLLLVSSMGLAVNLFGMFAMGGHHHHGHSHSHSHGHSHSEGHSPLPQTPSRPHSHSHVHDDDHSHSHSPGTEGGEKGHSHTHESPTSSHSHSHSHSSVHAHSHSHSPQHDGHSHSQTQHAHHHHSDSHGSIESLDEDLPIKSSRRRSSIPIPALHIQPDTPTVEAGEAGQFTPVKHQHHHLHQESLASPITPSYRFGHDAHYAAAHGHEHGIPNLHDHSHVHVHDGEREGHSHNMRGVFLHVMADTLGSVGVIISTLLIQFYGWTGFDPIASLFIAVLIAASVVPLVIDTGKVLCLDVGEKDSGIKAALKEVTHIPGVVSYTYPRFWPKDSSSMIGSIHVQLAPALIGSGSGESGRIDRVVERVDEVLRGKISGLEELTIQVEGEGRRDK